MDISFSTIASAKHLTNNRSSHERLSIVLFFRKLLGKQAEKDLSAQHAPYARPTNLPSSRVNES